MSEQNIEPAQLFQTTPGPTFEEQKLDIEPVEITPTPTEQKLKVPSFEEQKLEVKFDDITPTPMTSPRPEEVGTCACSALARTIFAQFKRFIEHRNTFDSSAGPGRISRAIAEVAKTDLGKNELKQNIIDWTQLLQKQEGIYNGNLDTLENIAYSVPKFKETNTGDKRTTCTPSDWADAMIEIAYITNHALDLFKSKMEVDIKNTPTTRTNKSTMCKLHATQEQCETKGSTEGCIWKKPLIAKNYCDFNASSYSDIDGLVKKVTSILTVTQKELENEAALARANYALLIPRIFHIGTDDALSQSDLDICYMDDCNTFGEKLADAIWAHKIAISPKYIPVPDEKFDEFVKQINRPVFSSKSPKGEAPDAKRIAENKQNITTRFNNASPTTQKMLRELKNIRQQLDLLQLKQASCRNDLIAAYIVYMWTVGDLL